MSAPKEYEVVTDCTVNGKPRKAGERFATTISGQVRAALHFGQIKIAEGVVKESAPVQASAPVPVAEAKSEGSPAKPEVKEAAPAASKPKAERK